MSSLHKDQTAETQRWKGYAAKDLEEDSESLEVIVPSLLPGTVTGDFGSAKAQMSSQTKDLKGNVTTVQSEVKNHIHATWKGNSNSPYPPRVVAGEPVIITREGGTDDWLWEETGRGRDYRKTDRFRMEVAATDEKSFNTTKDDNNTYSVEADSDRGFVRLKTSKQRGEPYSYTVGIDTKNGRIELTDDADAKTPNRIVIDSCFADGPTVHMNNVNGTTIKLVGDDIFFFAPRDIVMRAKRQIVYDAPTTTFNPHTEDAAIVVNAKGMTLNISDNCVIKSASVGISGPVILDNVLISAEGVRAPQIVNGAGDTFPSPTTTDVDAGSNSIPASSPNTDVSGGDDRSLVAYPEFMDALSSITGFFGAAKVHPGSAITNIGKGAEVKTVRGK